MKPEQSFTPCAPARHYTQRHSVQHKNSNILNLFLKLRYAVVIPMLFKLMHKKIGGHLAFFQAIVPQSTIYLCGKPGSIEKRPPFCLFARPNHALRALITRNILRNMNAQCNAIPWNHLKRFFFSWPGY